MSKYKAIYENNQIVYWPFFDRCLGLIIFSGIIIIDIVVFLFVIVPYIIYQTNILLSRCV